LQPRLQWKGLGGFHEEATQGNVHRGGGAFLVACNDLNIQPASVSGICSTKII
jgi:hypothetical protein